MRVDAPVYELYQKLLQRYWASYPSSGGQAFYCRSLEKLTLTVAQFQMKRRDTRFPQRAIGGWWSIGRLRFEIIMRWFEYNSVEKVREIVRSGMTVIDIGAHIGYYTRLLSELVGPTGRVIAFEPHPENFEVLQYNLKDPEYRNVEPLNYAVSDRDQIQPLYVSPGHSNHSLVRGFTEAEAVLEVRSVTLDTILKEKGIEKVDFIKSDTEGAEPLVLSGMAETIARSDSLFMLIEFHPAALRCLNIEPESFPEQIRQLGFEIEMIGSEFATRDIYRNMLVSPSAGAGVRVGV